jgi:hypothetical protein
LKKNKLGQWVRDTKALNAMKSHVQTELRLDKDGKSLASPKGVVVKVPKTAATAAASVGSQVTSEDLQSAFDQTALKLQTALEGLSAMIVSTDE